MPGDTDIILILVTWNISLESQYILPQKGHTRKHQKQDINRNPRGPDKAGKCVCVCDDYRL